MASTSFDRKMGKTGRWVIPQKGSQVPWVGIAQAWQPIQRVLGCISSAMQADELCIPQTRQALYLSHTAVWTHSGAHV